MSGDPQKQSFYALLYGIAALEVYVSGIRWQKPETILTYAVWRHFGKLFAALKTYDTIQQLLFIAQWLQYFLAIETHH
jgi:hypothetical protein